MAIEVSNFAAAAARRAGGARGLHTDAARAGGSAWDTLYLTDRQPSPSGSVLLSPRWYFSGSFGGLASSFAMPPRKPLHNHPPPKQPSRRNATQPARQDQQRGRSAHRQPAQRSPAGKQQARAELRAVRDALDGLAYHDKNGEVRFVGQRHGMASGVDLREAWAATTRIHELASSRDAKMEELEHAHTRAVGNLSSAKEQLAHAARRLATERADSGRSRSATYRSPYRASPPRTSPTRTATAMDEMVVEAMVEAAMDDALHNAKAALAAAGGDFHARVTRKVSPAGKAALAAAGWGPSAAEAVRGRAGSRTRAAEVAAQDAAQRARESRRQAQAERTAAREPMRELEAWLDVQPSTSPLADMTMSSISSTAIGESTRRASEEARAVEDIKKRPGGLRPASESIASSGAAAAVGMDLQPRSSSPSNSRGARSRTAGDVVSSAVVWGSVRRHMKAVHTHRRRAAAAAVRKCPPVARRLLASALYRCPAVQPPSRPRSPNVREAPQEGRRISRVEFRAACAEVIPRHASLAHNLSSTTIDTLTEW